MANQTYFAPCMLCAGCENLRRLSEGNPEKLEDVNMDRRIGMTRLGLEFVFNTIAAKIIPDLTGITFPQYKCGNPETTEATMVDGACYKPYEAFYNALQNYLKYK